MTLSLIVALSQNGVIGKNNKLPWHLSEDLKRFKSLTMGHKIVMGRKTFEAIGKPLPGRENIVLTRDPDFHADGVAVIHEPGPVVAMRNEEIFVIGGEQVYRLFLPVVDRLYLTVIKQDFSGDAFFPLLDWRDDFQTVDQSSVMHSAKNDLTYEFITVDRKSGSMSTKNS